MVDRDKTLNTCKYWIENEPEVCGHWDDTLTKCTFEGEIDERIIKASRYPYCNLIGTAAECSHYDGAVCDVTTGGGCEARCVLPDPYRHVCNRKTGTKWVWMRTPEKRDEEGDITEAADWTFEYINEYNDGECDGSGTATTCSGYAPRHLGFGRLKPEPLPADLLAELDKPWTGYKTEADLGYRLPLSYDIWNARAELSRCYWWDDDPEEFSIDEDMGFINPIDFHCTNSDEIIDQYENHSFDPIGRYIPPCNGAHDECPRYTGVCWQYCIVDKMQEGDKVLAEQILELRYHLRKEKWDLIEYTKSFIYPHIFSWVGAGGIHYAYTSTGDLDVEKTTIDTIETYQNSFGYLDIQYKKIPISKGQPAQDGKTDYPTLIGELKSLYLRPIIRNVFDTDESGNYFFEVTDLDHEEILIVGDTFWYNSITYGLNLNDPEIMLMMPSRSILLEHNSMADIEFAMKEKEGKFDEYYNQLDGFLEYLKDYAPDKLIPTEIGSLENMFYIPAKTYFGENTIVVFNKGSGRWEFDKIAINKSLCGGFIGQTSFEVEGEGGVINKLPWYEKDFYTRQNENGLIEFEFISFAKTEDPVAYVYNDHFTEVIGASPLASSNLYHQSYKFYKVIAYGNTILDAINMKILGNSGYILLIVPDEDKKLHNVHRSWEIDGDIYLNVTDSEGEVQNIKMEIYEQGTDRLEVNQMILKPSEIIEFSQACDASIHFPEIYTYEKRSFGEEPSGDIKEEIIEITLGEDDSLVYSGQQIEKKEGDRSGTYELSKFNNEDMFISAVYRGAGGRIKGITRTKMLTWVRQPFCRDVEISYRWGAAYIDYMLLPNMDCWMGLLEPPREQGRTQHFYSPPCGDHDLGVFSGLGPMWYPYNACPPDVRYNIITQLTEYDINVIEQFPSYGGKEHGAFDLRMMGPHDKYGRTCDTHASLWNCTCDWSFCNEEKITSNVFLGWARYRGGLSDEDIIKCLSNDGEMPKFGNVYRDFLRSYRSMDNIFYYRVDGTSITRTYKWVPMYQMYTKSDITADVNDYPFRLYTRDYDSPFTNQLGLLRAFASIENVDIKETVDYDNRFRFEDIMEAHSSLVGLRYPYQRNPSFVGIKQLPLVSWYRFKDYPIDSTKSIQWIWQEIWRELERHNVLLAYTGESEVEQFLLYNPPYKEEEVGVIGKHLFLDIEHPSYLSSARLEEHRTVCEEGGHTITIVPCVPNAEDILVFLVMLDEGPFRIFDLDGNWVTEVPEIVSFGDEAYDDNIEKYIKTYEASGGSEWYQNVTLYEEGTPIIETASAARDAAESDNRVVESYDDMGDVIKLYYQRGLNIVVDPNMFYALPYNTIKFSGPMDFSISNPPQEGEPYSNMEPEQFYGFDGISPYMLHYDNAEANDIIFDFLGHAVGDDPPEGHFRQIIYKMKIVYEIGAIQPEDYNEDIPEIWTGELYHVPAVGIHKGNTLASFSRLYDGSGMTLSNRNSAQPSFHEVEYDLSSAMDLKNPYRYLKLSFRFNPTPTEKENADIDKYYSLCSNMVKIVSIQLYSVEPVEATESIYTYERKYNVSYGDHGDFPPQGTDNSGSLLYPLSGDRSTAYQRDSLAGVVGMPNSGGEVTSVNKCRGRIMKECHPDKEKVAGRNVYDYEATQKGVHDNIAIGAGSVVMGMEGVLPPDLKKRLDELGIRIPHWEARFCYFLNSIVLPLASVLPKDAYSPCGHEFFHDASTINAGSTAMCGRLFARIPRNDVFEYGYRNPCIQTSAQWHQIDAVHAYYGKLISLGAYTLNPLAIKQADAIRQSKMDYSTNTTENITSMAVPETVLPFI